ncbi:MAG TPA: hypothetical protein VFP72_10745 [Kineosporiaceae bacterium]|nr:hypothetical protein [Kineosporiaceae bacterium]
MVETVPPGDLSPAADLPGPLSDRTGGRSRGVSRLVRVVLLLLVLSVPAAPPLSRALLGGHGPAGSPDGSAPAGGSAGGSGEQDAAPALGPGVAATAVPAVLALLQDRAAAVTRRDRTAWLAVIDPAARSTTADQDAAIGRILALPVTRWRYRLLALALAPARPAAGGTALTARVQLIYRLAGDTRDVLRERELTLVAGRSGALLEAETAAATDRDLWDLGPLTVVQGSRGSAVVLGGDPEAARALAALVAESAAGVDAVWGTSWPRSVVVVLPADRSGMAALLGGADPSGLDRLAAVTSGMLDRGSTRSHALAAADRVVLNPQSWPQLTPVGRRVVLTHELTHVATRATTAATPPLWLDEGFAQYVGYRDSGLPAVTVAADAVDLVRRTGQVPDALPTADAFDPARGGSQAAYAQAWVACDLVARRAGPSGLARLYREAASADGGQAQADVALREVLGEDRQTFLGQWQAALRTLAGAGG